MKRAKLIKRTEQLEQEQERNKPQTAPAAAIFNRDVVRQWIIERKSRTAVDARSAFSTLFAQ